MPAIAAACPSLPCAHESRELTAPACPRAINQAEEDVAAALATFMQNDESVARSTLLKLEGFLAALERSSFFPRHRCATHRA